MTKPKIPKSKNPLSLKHFRARTRAERGDKTKNTNVEKSALSQAFPSEALGRAPARTRAERGHRAIGPQYQKTTEKALKVRKSSTSSILLQSSITLMAIISHDDWGLGSGVRVWGHQAGLPDWFYNTFLGLKGGKRFWQQQAIKQAAAAAAAAAASSEQQLSSFLPIRISPSA